MLRPATLVLVAAIGLSACGTSGSSRAISDPVPVPATDSPPPNAAPGGTLPSGLTQPTFGLPARLAAGRLAGLAGHRGAGDASVWRQPDGTHIVRLDDYEVSNVGGLAVYLVPGAAADRTDGGVRLGPLPAHRGTVNVPIPPGAAVTPPLTVLVWSDEARLPVASATGT